MKWLEQNILGFLEFSFTRKSHLSFEMESLIKMLKGKECETPKF